MFDKYAAIINFYEECFQTVLKRTILLSHIGRNSDEKQYFEGVDNKILYTLIELLSTRRKDGDFGVALVWKGDIFFQRFTILSYRCSYSSRCF